MRDSSRWLIEPPLARDLDRRALAPAQQVVEATGDDGAGQPRQVGVGERLGQRALELRREPELPGPAGDQPRRQRDQRAPVDVAVLRARLALVERGDVELPAADHEVLDGHDRRPGRDPDDQRDHPRVEALGEVARLDERHQHARGQHAGGQRDLPARDPHAEGQRGQPARVEVEDVGRDRAVQDQQQHRQRHHAEGRQHEVGGIASPPHPRPRPRRAPPATRSGRTSPARSPRRRGGRSSRGA